MRDEELELDDSDTRPILSADEEAQIKRLLEGAKGRSKRTHSYYQKMKRENPKLYNKPETQEQMVRD